MSSRKRKMPDDGDESGTRTASSLPSLASTIPKWHPGLASSEPSIANDGYFRNLYAAEPDFKQLARQDAAFAAVLVST